MREFKIVGEYKSLRMGKGETCTVRDTGNERERE